MQTLQVGRYAGAVQASLDRLKAQRFFSRLWERDASLWSADAAVQAAIRHRLGWLRIAEVMAPQAQALRAFAQEIRKAGFTHGLLLGMGGSGLFTEVCRKTFGVAPGAAEITVLDTTDATAILTQQQGCPLAQLFVIVSSKSGSTSEISALSRYFYGAFKAAGLEPSAHCIAITDEGTSLASQAKQLGYRRAFIHGPETGTDVGGRFSALTYFGLVPASLMGVEVDRLLQRAREMLGRCRGDVPLEDNPAAQLGAALASLALAGRDKMTLICSPELASFGTWVEQLVAESVGKSGKGIPPFFGEPLRDPAGYGDDRVFVELQLASQLDRGLDRRVQELADAGHPVVRIHWADRYDLGAEVAKWAVATGVAGHLMDLNPFDEPNVKESKDRTKALLEQFGKDGKYPEGEPPQCLDGDIAVFGRHGNGRGHDLRGCLRELFGQLRPKEYVAVLSFLPRTPSLDQIAERMRERIGQQLGCATMIGFGPRYLHSTGQLYKGGPDNALFLLLTAEGTPDLPIPGEPFSFNVLKQAQALGDFQAMQQRGRRMLRVHLTSDPERAIARVVSAVDGALASAISANT